MADLIVGRGLIRIHPSEGDAVAALRGVDLTVGEGEIAAVVGPSGSGKSTLLRLVAGLDRPSAGRLSVAGLDIGSASASELDAHRRDRIGVVEQHYRRALSPYLTAAAAIDLPLALRGVPTAERRARVDELLGAVGLADRGGAYRMQLSGGEQQRVAFAVALAHRPSLLLADEPTGELDGATAADVLAILRDLVRSDGVDVPDRDPRRGRRAHRRPGRPPRRRSGGGRAARTARCPGRAVRRHARLARTAAAGTRRAQGSGTARIGRRPGHHPRGRVAAVRDRRRPRAGPAADDRDVPTRRVPRRDRSVRARASRRCCASITGLDRPTSGRVVTLGQDMADLGRDELARFRSVNVGLVDQVRDLVPFLSALENVELGLAIRDQAGPGSRGASARRPRAVRPRRRTRIARRMACPPANGCGSPSPGRWPASPALLVLDEPTAALDRHGAAAVAALLAGARRRRGHRPGDDPRPGAHRGSVRSPRPRVGAGRACRAPGPPSAVARLSRHQVGRPGHHHQADAGEPQAGTVGQDLDRLIEPEGTERDQLDDPPAETDPARDRQDRERQRSIDAERADRRRRTAGRRGRASRRPTRKTRMPAPSNALPVRAGRPPSGSSRHQGRTDPMTTSTLPMAARVRPRPSGRRCMVMPRTRPRDPPRHTPPGAGRRRSAGSGSARRNRARSRRRTGPGS